MCCLFLRNKFQNPNLSAITPRDTGSSPSTIPILTKKKELGSRTASTGLLAKKSVNKAPLISRVTLSTWTATASSRFKIRTLWPSVRIGSRSLNSLLQSKLQTIARRRGISLSTANGISLCMTLKTLILICTRRLTRARLAPLMSQRRRKTTTNHLNAQKHARALSDTVSSVL
jgi:hypothetical protein